MVSVGTQLSDRTTSISHILSLHVGSNFSNFPPVFLSPQSLKRQSKQDFNPEAKNKVGLKDFQKDKFPTKWQTGGVPYHLIKDGQR